MDEATMSGTLGGPIHVSVDGTLRNPHVAAGMIVLAVVAAILTYHGIKLLRGRRYTGVAVIVGVLVVMCIAASALVRLLAFCSFSIATHRLNSMTFFGSPPAWILPGTVVFAAAIAAISTRTTRVDSSTNE